MYGPPDSCGPPVCMAPTVHVGHSAGASLMCMVLRALDVVCLTTPVPESKKALFDRLIFMDMGPGIGPII